jgi:hypothetical protein
MQRGGDRIQENKPDGDGSSVPTPSNEPDVGFIVHVNSKTTLVDSLWKSWHFRNGADFATDYVS